MIGQDVKRAAGLLKEGALVAIPTETVYGLAANALNDAAVAQIFEAKDRPAYDPLIIHTDRIEKIQHLVEEIPAPLKKLLDAFSPGPLTFLLRKKADGISDQVTAGLPTVAVRIPAHPITQELLSLLDFPVAAPSANPFGYISPTRAQHVADQLGEQVPYILDGGNCDFGLESTIVGLTDGQVRVFRKGGISIEDIEGIVGPVLVNDVSASNPKAPGMLKSHYAPKTPIYVGQTSKVISNLSGKKIAYIGFNMLNFELPVEDQYLLSMGFDLKEAASNLFAVMRQLDQSKKYDAIVADWFPDQGIGKAINDRLRRASSEFQ